MSHNQQNVEIENVRVIRETMPGKMNAGALLIRTDDGEEVWIPKSLIHEDSEAYNAEDHSEGTLILSEWFAIDKGLV